MRIYIAGKISGLPKEEYTAKFKQAEGIIWGYGCEPVNPVTICAHLPEDTPPEMYYLKGFEALLTCEAIYLLPCWKDSKGARMEKYIAEEMGLTIFYHEK